MLMLIDGAKRLMRQYGRALLVLMGIEKPYDYRNFFTSNLGDISYNQLMANKPTTVYCGLMLDSQGRKLAWGTDDSLSYGMFEAGMMPEFGMLLISNVQQERLRNGVRK